MDNHGIAKLLLSLAGNDTDRLERAEGATVPGPSCPPLPRFRSAVLREDWTAVEQRHKVTCAYCQKTEGLARTETWHPPLVSLFWQARDLFDHDGDVAHHLQKDACRRCQRLVAVFQVDRLLGRLATQIRQGLAGAAARLGQLLESGVVAAFPGLAAAAQEQPFAFEGGRYSATLFRSDAPRLRLEQRGGDAPRLQRLLLGGRKECWDQFVVLRPGKEPHMRTAELRPERLPSEPAVLVLHDVDAAVLDREDVPRLRESFVAVGKSDPLALAAWHTWASQTLKRAGLDAAVCTALEGLARLDGNPPPKMAP